MYCILRYIRFIQRIIDKGNFEIGSRNPAGPTCFYEIYHKKLN